MENIERWIEMEDGVALDGFPKSRYKHNSCDSVAKAYPYCPYCGKRITHIKTVDKDFNWFWERKGFICE